MPLALTYVVFPRAEHRGTVRNRQREANGEAKFWLEPAIELARSYGLSDTELRRLEQSVQGHEQEIRNAWNDHFAS